MSFFLGRALKLGIDFIARGFGGGGGGGPPPTVAIVSVCGDIETARDPRAATRTASLVRGSITVETRVDGDTRTAPRIVGRIDVSEC